MKYAILFIVSIFITQLNIYAHDREPSTLKVMLSDNSPLLITIDGRDYKKRGSSLTIHDLPRGWHSLRVYEYIEYKRGGGRARLVYSGRVKVKSGLFTTCEVDVRTGRMSMRTTDRPINSSNAKVVEQPTPITSLTEIELKKLGEEVDEYATDGDRLKVIKGNLKEKSYSSEQLKEMTKWLVFDDSKLDLVLWSYNSISDKENYSKLKGIFSLETTKKEFEQYDH